MFFLISLFNNIYFFLQWGTSCFQKCHPLNVIQPIFNLRVFFMSSIKLNLFFIGNYLLEIVVNLFLKDFFHHVWVLELRNIYFFLVFIFKGSFNVDLRDWSSMIIAFRYFSLRFLFDNIRCILRERLFCFTELFHHWGAVQLLFFLWHRDTLLSHLFELKLITIAILIKKLEFILGVIWIHFIFEKYYLIKYYKYW